MLLLGVVVVVVVQATQRSPVVVVGLPKTGTTSLAQFFRCTRFGHVSHHLCGAKTCGECARDNKLAQKALFDGCRYDVYAELDDIASCTLPQVNDLAEIDVALPNATLILSLRPAAHWLRSLTAYASSNSTGRASFRDQFAACLLRLGVVDETSDAALLAAFDAHTRRVLDFARAHPQHRFLTLDIESPSAGAVLSRAFGGIDASCWQQHNAMMTTLRRTD